MFGNGLDREQAFTDILSSVNSIKTTTTKKSEILFLKADMTKRNANNGDYLR